MVDRFKQLDSESEHKDTVLSFLPSSMFKVGEFMLTVKEQFDHHGLNALRERLKSRGEIPGNSNMWFDKGVDCEILSPINNGWQKGKIRIKVTLEFCPDELEIPETPASNNPKVRTTESGLEKFR